MRYGCIGRSLGHSYSPEIHSLIGRYEYDLTELSESDLAPFLSERSFSGINVTIPYKQAVIPMLDRLSLTAATIGAVNTIVNRSGELYGYNTDYSGLLSLIRSMSLDLTRKKVLILGTGGTSRTARYAAKALRAAQIICVSRNPKDDSISYEMSYRFHSDADVLINTTPCGMFPDTDGIPVDLSRFQHLQGVVDVVYNPLSSRLVLEARELGIPARGGLRMLVSQAVAASELFTGSPCEAGTEERILQDLILRRRNLVLTGMPGSGKTAVGRRIAAILGRPFVDLDESVVRRTGKPIQRIFSEDGETAFRDAESEAVMETAGQTGLVVATGGGCVLRRENVRRLRMNGWLAFLDRPPASLVPTADRPLSDSTEKMESLYQSRYPVYRNTADRMIPAVGGIDKTAEAVIQAFYEEAAL